MKQISRRQFLSTSIAAAAASQLPSHAAGEPAFKISLAAWSLHLAFFGKKLDYIDFPLIAKRDFGIEAVEHVNQFWMDKAKDQSYLTELKKRGDDNGVKHVLIMCDREGALGDANETKRNQAVDNHQKWLDAAKFLGCHSIRVNAATDGKLPREEQQKHAVAGLRKLAELGGKLDLNVIVENHGGLSSDGSWLAAVMKDVGLKNCGTLPDFGNFRLADGKEYDRYQGVDELMPFAKGVSAKSNEFDDKGNEIKTDYVKMLDIVLKKHNYHGYIGVEYEGKKLSEPDGIKATKALLERFLVK